MHNSGSGFAYYRVAEGFILGRPYMMHVLLDAKKEAIL